MHHKINDPAILSALYAFPNQGILWEIIEKGQIGKIFELPAGALLILENSPDPFVFIAGHLTPPAVNAAISIMADRKFPMIHCAAHNHPLFLKKGWNFHLRAELKLKSFLPVSLSDQALVIRSLDSLTVLEKCFWYKDRVELYGSAENLLAAGWGYALCLQDQIISEVYGAVGQGYAEIGIVTHPHYRGKGYALQIASYFIQKCREKNITPMWSCNVDNRASLVTALKLGFEISRYDVQLVHPEGNVARECPRETSQDSA